MSVRTSTVDSITAQYLARFRRAAEALGSPSGLLPVTGAQRRFVIARHLDAARRPDIVPLFFAFPRGSVDLDRLRTAAGYLAAAHPALRARSGVVRGVPVQRLVAPVSRVERVVPRPGEGAAGALRRALADWPEDGPPLRLLLADATAAEAAREGWDESGEGEEGQPREVLALALDHAVCDEQSLGLLSAGLADAYEHRLGPADVPAQRAADDADAYLQAVSLQLDAEQRASGPGALAYWTGRLDPGPERRAGRDAFVPDTERPSGVVRARLPLPAGHEARAVAFPALLDACGGAARTLLAGGAGRTGGERVPLLGYPWGGRPAKAEPVLGCFLNTVVHPAATAAPAATAEESALAWWDDLDHADVPYDEVVRAVRAHGVPWRGGLDGLLTFEDLHRRPPLRLGDAKGREIHIDGRPLQAPLVVAVSHGEDLLVRLAWDRGAVTDTAAEAAFDQLTSAIRAHLDPTHG